MKSENQLRKEAVEYLNKNIKGWRKKVSEKTKVGYKNVCAVFAGTTPDYYDLVLSAQKMVKEHKARKKQLRKELRNA